jgi:integrase
MKNILDHFICPARDSKGRARWRIDICDAAGIRHRDKFFDRDKARDAVANHIGARESSRAGNAPALPDMPLAELHEQYLEKLRAENANTTYIQRAERDIARILRDKSFIVLADVTRAKLENWKFKDRKRTSARGAQVAPATVNAAIRVFSQMLNYGVDLGLISHNPVARFKLLPTDDPRTYRPDHLTVEDVAKLFAVIDDADLRDMATLVLETGLRRGEMLALEFDDVDTKDGVVHLRAKKIAGKHWAPKWRKERDVPLSERALRMLILRRHRLKEGFVFPGPGGKMRDAKSTYYLLRRRLRRAGIANPEHRSWHTLRHTFISHQLQSGCLTPRQVMAIVGHSDAATLMRYSHVHASETKGLKIITPYGPHSVSQARVQVS